MFPKSFLSTVLFLSAFAGSVNAQQPPYVTRTPDPEIQRQREFRVIRSHIEALDALSRSRELSTKRLNPGRAGVLMAQYRRSSVEELQLLAADDADRVRFAAFLKQANTGLIKLVADLGCDEYSVRKPAINICERFSMPGGGSAYSFRQNDYQMWKFADLLYDGKSFFAFGQMSQGFLVDLGKTPLNEVTRKTIGVEYVFSFTPAVDRATSAKQNADFVEGLRTNGFEYTKLLATVVGNTYILRSIAYNGNAPRTNRGLSYNELDFDKRKDIIVAFTVLQKDFNDTITVLWRTLQTKRSPILK